MVPDSELSKMTPQARDDTYEVMDRLINWGKTNYKIVKEVCDVK